MNACKALNEQISSGDADTVVDVEPEEWKFTLKFNL